MNEMRNSSGFSGAKTTDQQNEEIEAIKAIYSEDFTLLPTQKGAWGTDGPKQFILNLKSQSQLNVSDPVFAKLLFLLNSTYPLSPIEVRISECKHISNTQKTYLEKNIKDIASAKQGSPAIFEITSYVQDYLNEVQSELSQRSKSLNEIRQMKVENDQEEVRKRKELATAQKQQIREQEIQELKIRLRKEKANRSAKNDTEFEENDIKKPDKLDMITLERPLHLGKDSVLYSLNNLTALKINDARQLYLYSARTQNHSVIIQKFTLCSSLNLDAEGRDKLVKFETVLERARSIGHQNNIVPLLDFKIDTSEECPILYLFQTFKPLGNLKKALKLCGRIDLRLARYFCIDLLEALQKIHAAGLVHSLIHSSNVYFTSELNRNVAAFTNYAFPHLLKDLLESRCLMKMDSEAFFNFPYPSGWICPEHRNLELENIVHTKKTDIWYLGVLACKLLYPDDIFQKYQNPWELVKNKNIMPSPVNDFLIQMFRKDPKKRPTCSNLLTSHFCRIGVDSEYTQNISYSTLKPSPDLLVGSINDIEIDAGEKKSFSRFQIDFEPLESLGKGGYGRVIKAKNRVDGNMYAIKIVPLLHDSSENARVLREVVLLSRLNHERIVRYFSAWIEAQTPASYVSESDKENDSDGELVSFSKPIESFSTSVQNNSEILNIEFANSSGFNDPESPMWTESDIEDKSYQNASTYEGMLYIQMEYCEYKSMSDIFEMNLDASEKWRLFRQILEGLDYIHSQGMIHRDLKLSNIFIDKNLNIKLGDFGLAIESQNSIEIQHLDISDNQDMTTEIGTAIYIAPELISNGSKTYTEKIDMYSLGIILFQMFQKFATSMEKFKLIKQLRSDTKVLEDLPAFPVDSPQRKLTEILLSANQDKRPSARELLNGDILPRSTEDLAIENMHKYLRDSKSAPVRQLLKTWFRGTSDSHFDNLYDISSQEDDWDEKIVTFQMKAVLFEILNQSGAQEVDVPGIFPLSPFEMDFPDVVRFIDQNGNIFQLSYNLFVPICRLFSKTDMLPQKSFAFQDVFRLNAKYHHTVSTKQLSFILLHENNTRAILDTAETIKTLDQCITGFIESDVEYVIYLNHTSVFREALRHLQIPKSKQSHFCKLLSENLFKVDNLRMSQLLRNEMLIPSSLLDLFKRLNFQQSVQGAIDELKQIFPNSYFELERSYDQFLQLDQILSLYSIKAKVLINPLAVSNPTYFVSDSDIDGIIFSAVVEKEPKKSVVAFGGHLQSILDNYEAPRKEPENMSYGIGFCLDCKALKKLIKPMHPVLSVSKRIPNAKPRHNLFFKYDLVIGNIGKPHLDSLISFCEELREKDIKCTFYANTLINMDELSMQAKQLGANWSAILRLKRQNYKEESVKVRDLKTGEDFEFTKTNFANFILGKGCEPKVTESYKSEDVMASVRRFLANIVESNVKFVPINKKRDKKSQKPFNRSHYLLGHSSLNVGIKNCLIQNLTKAPIFLVDIDDSEFQQLFLTTRKSPEATFMLETFYDEIEKGNQSLTDQSFWVFNVRSRKLGCLQYLGKLKKLN